MKKLNEIVDKVIELGEELVSITLKFIFGMIPVVLILMIVIALVMKAFRVIVLGETP